MKTKRCTANRCDKGRVYHERDWDSSRECDVCHGTGWVLDEETPGVSPVLRDWLLAYCAAEAKAGRLCWSETRGAYEATTAFEPARLAIAAWNAAKEKAAEIASENTAERLATRIQEEL